MKYERIVLNFDEGCNLSCPFCYTPFTGEPVDFRVVSDVLRECKNLDVKVITFSGGDPFNHPAFRSLLYTASHLGFEIHVDTNGISLLQEDYSIIGDTCSLLGLPLDGPTALTHDGLRKAPGHFSLVLHHLRRLEEFPVRLKINTIVSGANLKDVSNIIHLVNQYDVAIWSLYQFMALCAAADREDLFTIEDSVFAGVVDRISSMKHRFRLEAGNAKKRLKSYLFVSPVGRMYTHDAYSADFATRFRRNPPPCSDAKRHGVPVESATPGRSVATLDL